MPLSPGLDLSTYRIIQERLTNSLTHTRAPHAHVGVRYGTEVLKVRDRAQAIVMAPVDLFDR